MNAYQQRIYNKIHEACKVYSQSKTSPSTEHDRDFFDICGDDATSVIRMCNADYKNSHYYKNFSLNKKESEYLSKSFGFDVQDFLNNNCAGIEKNYQHVWEWRSIAFTDQDLLVEKLALQDWKTILNDAYHLPIDENILKVLYKLTDKHSKDDITEHLYEELTELEKQVTAFDIDAYRSIYHSEAFDLSLNKSWGVKFYNSIKESSDYDNYKKLFQLCFKLKTGTPNKKTFESIEKIKSQFNEDQLKAKLLELLTSITVEKDKIDEHYLNINNFNSETIASLIVVATTFNDDSFNQPFLDLALEGYRKVSGLGPQSIKVGNSAIYALSITNSMDGLYKLAILKSKLRSTKMAQKTIEKYMSEVAKRKGISTEQLLEISVPDYGLDQNAEAIYSFDDYTFKLWISNPLDVESQWFNCNTNKPLKSAPADIKNTYPDELSELRADVKNIALTLTANKQRLESYILNKASWEYPYFKQHYLDHPLMGPLSKSLVWSIHQNSSSVHVMYLNDQWVDQNLQPVVLSDDTEIHLFHALDASSDELLKWKSLLEQNQITQAFKQVYRETYVLTPAERETHAYSNRFAAHVLFQHPLNTLGTQRGWDYKLQGAWDGDTGIFKSIPAYDIRVSFYVPRLGTELTDYGGNGDSLYLSSDYIEFHRLSDRKEIIPLEDVPELVFSEILRDVDLFVSVCSIGNDPEWVDKGHPDKHTSDYWHSYNSGHLSENSKIRKELLQRILSSANLVRSYEFEERYLLIHGKLKSYRIHIRSGNVIMQPENRYLCIVPKVPKKSDPKIHLPFTGDTMLSTILSKAIMLSNDDKIKDESISSQLRQ
jgi:hypothetical protein